MSKLNTIGVDLAKNIIQVSVVSAPGKELQNIKPEGHDEFMHLDFEYSDPDCADCHTGQIQEE